MATITGLAFISNAVNGLTLQLEVVSPNGPAFKISEKPEMPQIKLRASVCGGDAAANKTAWFDWSVTLRHESPACRHQTASNNTSHNPLNARTFGGDWTIPFKDIRGGKLEVTVKTTAKAAGGKLTPLSVVSKDLRIVGTNPAITTLSTTIPNNVLKQIARHESSLRQFLDSRDGACACPYFSEDGKGGVGLFQITNPLPSADEIWNWRKNLERAKAMFAEKHAAAKGYPGQCRKDPVFIDLVRQFIEQQQTEFVAEKKKANPQAKELVPPHFQVVLPEYNDDELYDDTIRAFNGYGGVDNLGHRGRLHEFEVPIVPGDEGDMLDARVGADGKTATLQWQRVDPRRRRYDDGRPIGDPDYVANVKKQPLF